MTTRARAIPFLTFLILTLSAAALAEASLQILARSVPTFERSLFPNPQPTIPDIKLLYRGNSKFFDHDQNGFRNPNVPAQAEIVAIGDSHTYGTSVRSIEAWPRVLERLSECGVYSMALGGYGPLQYAELARKSIQLRPRLMVVGIYFGNDFFDNWEMYLSNPTKYHVPKVLLRPAIQLESKSPLKAKIVDFFNMGGATKDVGPNATIARKFLASNSALWGFLRALKNQFVGKKQTVFSSSFEKAVSALSPQQLQYASVFDSKDWRTILTARYRLAVEDSSEPRTMVGRWLTQLAIVDIRDTARSIGAKVLFVLLPTKEAVFASRVNEKEKHKYLEQLVLEEDLHRRHLVEFLKERDIAYIDASQVLGSLSDQPYFENADGHPNSGGHEAIANAIKASIRSCKPRDRALD